MSTNACVGGGGGENGLSPSIGWPLDVGGGKNVVAATLVGPEAK